MTVDQLLAWLAGWLKEAGLLGALLLFIGLLYLGKLHWDAEYAAVQRERDEWKALAWHLARSLNKTVELGEKMIAAVEKPPEGL